MNDSQIGKLGGEKRGQATFLGERKGDRLLCCGPYGADREQE